MEKEYLWTIKLRKEKKKHLKVSCCYNVNIMERVSFQQTIIRHKRRKHIRQKHTHKHTLI